MDSLQVLYQFKINNILDRHKYHKDAMIEQVKLLRKVSLIGLEEETKEQIKKILEEHPNGTIKRS